MKRQKQYLKSINGLSISSLNHKIYLLEDRDKKIKEELDKQKSQKSIIDLLTVKN